MFIVLYRTRDGNVRLRKYTIGPYGTVTPAIARATAQRILAARQEGRDPAGEKRQARIRNSLDVIDAVVDSYLLRFAARNRSAGETKRILNREILRNWSGRSIHGLTKQEVVSLLDSIVDRGSQQRPIAPIRPCELCSTGASSGLCSRNHLAPACPNRHPSIPESESCRIRNWSLSSGQQETRTGGGAKQKLVGRSGTQP
jgi:hypothetical protein